MPLTTEPRTAEAKVHRQRIAAVMESVAQVGHFQPPAPHAMLALRQEHAACGRLPVCCVAVSIVVLLCSPVSGGLRRAL